MFFILIVSLMLISSTCQREDDNHFVVTLKNQSDNDVYLCTRFTNHEGKCTLDRGGTLEKHSVIEFRPFNFSFERELGKNSILELYFVNPNQYNAHGIFYDCDSISIKNDVLKHYHLTLEDLQRMNWTIVYPPEK
jgi:hypothetical protein